MATDDLQFSVEEWLADESAPFEVLARCANATIAQGAFGSAVKMRPKAILLLRHGARVIERHGPK